MGRWSTTDPPLRADDVQNKLYINGRWVTGSGPRWDVINPSTEEVISTIHLAGAQDVEEAIHAATTALHQWKSTSPDDRAKYLSDIAERVDGHREALISLQMINSGKPYDEAQVDLEVVVETFQYYADLLREGPMVTKVELDIDGFEAEVLSETVGVAGLIVPWNFPMLTTAWKLAPALAAGCTVVVKPSEFTPLAELALAAIIDEVGLPPGVVNVIPGLGGIVGAKIVEDPRVRKIFFTGSDVVGKKILAQTASSVKNVSLELGGKSPIIIFADAQIDTAVELVTAGIFYNAGQMCSATSRLLVDSEIKDYFLAELLSKVKEIVVGGPGVELATMGPLISNSHYQRVSSMIEAARSTEGVKVLCGGQRPEYAGARGFFYAPTVIEINEPTVDIWREEVFGPVLCVMTFTDECDAVKLANNTVYGLAATVVTSCPEKGSRVAAQLQARFVTVNAPQMVSPKLSWGGYKEISLGRELGKFGLASFQEVKSIVKAVG